MLSLGSGKEYDSICEPIYRLFKIPQIIDTTDLITVQLLVAGSAARTRLSTTETSISAFER